jgi:O-antigen/teichoic acid export membrane protein
LSSLYKNVALLASSSFLTVLIGLASSKVWALLGGPPALAEQGLLVPLLGLSVLVASLGLGPGLVKLGAAALAQNDLERVNALRHAAWQLQFIIWLICALALFLGRSLIGGWSLGRSEATLEVLVIAIALWFALASALHTSTLNAFQRVSVLARSNVMVAFFSSLAGGLMLWKFGLPGVIWSVLVGAIAGWLAARTVVLRELGPVAASSRIQVLGAARTLLRFGFPFTLSMIAGQLVQFLLPGLILHELGRNEVGFYRVSSLIAVAYLGFLTNAMAQDYFPRLSALQTDSEVKEVMNRQHQLVMSLCVPVILGALWLAPLLVPLLTSPAFTPSIKVLEWQLVGDVLKLSSWVMAFVVLARAGSAWFLLTELVAGVTSLFASLWAMRVFGLPGLGIAYVITYGAYWLIVAVVVHRRFGLGLSAGNHLRLWSGFAAALIISAMNNMELASRFWLGGLMTAIIAVLSVFSLRSEWRSGRLMKS